MLECFKEKDILLVVINIALQVVGYNSMNISETRIEVEQVVEEINEFGRHSPYHSHSYVVALYLHFPPDSYL